MTQTRPPAYILHSHPLYDFEVRDVEHVRTHDDARTVGAKPYPEMPPANHFRRFYFINR